VSNSRLSVDPLHRADASPTLQASVVASDALMSRRLVAALSLGGVEVPEYARHADTDELLNGDSAELTDVTVLACDLSPAGEMTALRTFRRTNRTARVVAVTATGDDAGVREAINSGADAVVFGDATEAALAPVARAVAAGHICVPRRLRRCVVRPAFSHRERQVLAGVIKGLQNHEIAGELFLAESTVKSHLASSFHKLGVRSRKEAAALVLDPAEGLRALVLGELPQQ
jgi:DNA-binding NarL/FixJ family response regulator